MRAGKSIHEVGTRVRLKGITDDYDADLNGREGRLVRPFRHFPIRDVGVLLDWMPGDRIDDKTGKVPVPATVYLNEFEVIKP